MNLENSNARFEPTRWSLIEALRRSEGDAASELMRIYWPAVYAHLRRKQHGREEAAELTQAFFMTSVIHRRLFERADPAKGKLRSYVLTALRNFLADHPTPDDSSIDPSDLDREEQHIGGNGGTTFDGRWALSVLHEVLGRTQSHFEQSGKHGHWKLFEHRELLPAAHGLERLSYDNLAIDCGFANAPSARAALQVVRDRVDVLFHQVIGEGVDDPADIDEELASVKELLRA